MKVSPTYLADFMLIKLPPRLSGIVNKDTGFDFTNPVSTSLFLHEWAHYIHNISTLNGIYLYCSMLVLWSDFRWKLDKDGYASDAETLDPERLLNVRRAHGDIKKSRMINTASDRLENRSHSVTVVSHKLTINPLISKMPGWPEHSSTIDLVFDVGGEKIDAAVGVIEILECLAYLLEERYLVANKELPSVPKVAPYQLVSKLASHILPSITRDNIIRLCICSLQTGDPALSLHAYIGVCREKDDSETAEFLKERSLDTLSANFVKMKIMLDMVKGMFQKAEPMAVSVHEVTSLMETYLERRMIHPFFELELLDDVSKHDQMQRPILLSQMLVRSGICRMYLTRDGDPDQLLRDDIVAVKYDENYKELAFGDNKLHASFHYAMMHLDGESFRTEASLAELKSEARICPFYSACPYDLRRDRPDICKSAPWRSLSLDASVKESCWYREGVRATRRPDDE